MGLVETIVLVAMAGMAAVVGVVVTAVVIDLIRNRGE